MGEERPLSNGFRNWLGRTLQLDVRRAFASAPEALAALEETLASDSSYVAAPVALETFLAQYHAALTEPAAPRHDADAVDRAAAGRRIAVAAVAPAGRQSPPSPCAAAPTSRWRSPRVAPAPHAPARHAAVDRRRAAVAGAGAARQRGADARRADRRRRPAPLPTLRGSVATRGPRSARPMTLRESEAAGRSELSFLAARRLAGDDDGREQRASPAAGARRFDGRASRRPQPAPCRRRRLRGGRAARAGLPRPWSLAALIGGGVYARASPAAPPPVPQLGTLLVQSSPAGVEVFVDGVSRGMTPAQLSVSAGSHILELRGRGVPRVIPLQVPAGGAGLAVPRVRRYADHRHAGRALAAGRRERHGRRRRARRRADDDRRAWRAAITRSSCRARPAPRATR